MMILRRTLTDHPLVLVFVMLGLVIFHHGIRPYSFAFFLVIPPCQRLMAAFGKFASWDYWPFCLKATFPSMKPWKKHGTFLPKGPLRLEGQKLLRAVTSGDSFSEAALTAPLLISP